MSQGANINNVATLNRSRANLHGNRGVHVLRTRHLRRHDVWHVDETAWRGLRTRAGFPSRWRSDFLFIGRGGTKMSAVIHASAHRINSMVIAHALIAHALIAHALITHALIAHATSYSQMLASHRTRAHHIRYLLLSDARITLSAPRKHTWHRHLHIPHLARAPLMQPIRPTTIRPVSSTTELCRSTSSSKTGTRTQISGMLGA